MCFRKAHSTFRFAHNVPPTAAGGREVNSPQARACDLIFDLYIRLIMKKKESMANEGREWKVLPWEANFFATIPHHGARCSI
jgi:hypothetical protein